MNPRFIVAKVANHRRDPVDGQSHNFAVLVLNGSYYVTYDIYERTLDRATEQAARLNALDANRGGYGR